MKHIKEILTGEGFLVDSRTQVIGTDAAETYEYMGANFNDSVLEAVGDREWFARGDLWDWTRGVVIDPDTGIVEQIVMLDLRCDLVPTDQPGA